MKRLALYIKKRELLYNIIATFLIVAGLISCAIFPDNDIRGLTGLILFIIGFLAWLIGIIIIVTFLDIEEL